MGKLAIPDKVARPLSQIIFAFSVIFLFFAWLTSAGYLGFVAAAVCAIVPLLLGPRPYRIAGAVALLIGIAGAGLSSEGHQKDPYYIRPKVSEVYSLGSAYCAASEEYRLRNGTWPRAQADLSVQKTSARVSSLVFEQNGSFRIMLNFPPLEGKAIVFTPTFAEGTVQWKCSGTEIPEVYLPSGCRSK
jgi:hypothetical protein